MQKYKVNTKNTAEMLKRKVKPNGYVNRKQFLN